MYKKLSYTTLLWLKSTFFDTLKFILKKNRYPTLKDYLNVVSKQWDTVYHMARQEFIWRTVFDRKSGNVTFFDEREKIELTVDKGIIAKMTILLHDDKKLAQQKKKSISIEQSLEQAFAEGKLNTIADKNYLVYDIETSFTTNDLSKTVFYIGYAYVVEHGEGTYRYIDRENIWKFLDYLVNFDGYIIGYNSLAFDNPVTVSQGLVLSNRYSDDEYNRLLTIINEKSLDMFQFVRGLTGVRMGLNRLSRALVGVWKTLESGAESQRLREAYEEWDNKSLQTLKEYCKNDVKMTYLSLRYILLHEELSLENEEYQYTIDDIISRGNTIQQPEHARLNWQHTNIFSIDMAS